MKKAMIVLWPAFVAAGAGTVLLFTALDPVDLRFVGPLEFDRRAGYTIAFFFIWALTVASSAFTVFLARSADEVNRCPLVPNARPAGCPKREDPNAAC
jgi:hypothetical protein